MTVEKSPKSYGVAVTLCGLFGTLGVHHFYLGDWLHGLVDMALFFLIIFFFVQGFDALGLLALLLDAGHTIIVFYLLIIEKWRDGKGRLVAL